MGFFFLLGFEFFFQYILDINPLLDTKFVNIYPQLVACLFILTEPFAGKFFVVVFKNRSKIYLKK